MEDDPTADRTLERVADAWGVLLEGPDEARGARSAEAAKGTRDAPDASPEDPDPDEQAAA